MLEKDLEEQLTVSTDSKNPSPDLMPDIDKILEEARQGIAEYLDNALNTGRIDQQLYQVALNNTFPNLSQWLKDPYIDNISTHLREGVIAAIQKKQWEAIVNAYRQNIRFGTGGIRGMMAFDKASIEKMFNEGIDTAILKGPNTINDVVFLLTSVGVAQFGKSQSPQFEKIVIGYDSRVRGHDLAKKIAELFLAYGYTVYFFDEPCPYPEVTFAIPHESIKADVGILISASHNDYRYNGYKLSCANGSQFDPEQRDRMYEDYIRKAQTKDIKLCPFKDAAKDKLVFLGGDKPVEGFDYGEGYRMINIHDKHREQVRSFFLTPDLAERQQAASDPLHIGYCAYHGAGRKAVPRLLTDVGFVDVKKITRNGLNDLNGLFPSFNSEPGKEQQPDPGDYRAAKIAVDAFKEEYPGKFEELDILIGTDPDADRCGVVVKVPAGQRAAYGDKDYVLLSADDVWTLLLWYRFFREKEKYGEVQEAETKFLTLSHTTTDSVTALAKEYGVGVVKTWVGFAALAAATRDVWEASEEVKAGLFRVREGQIPNDKSGKCHPFVCGSQDMDMKRSFNIAAMEQSNGFSILGGPPPDERSLGVGGHVRDKDGTFAAVLVAEIAAWAKEQGKSIISLLDEHIYLNPNIGLYMTFYEPDPLDGEYPGIEGDRLKKAILRRALGYFQFARLGEFELGGLQVKSATIYRTGKYDAIYPATMDFQFPDEGIRFYFDDEKKQHLTVRPSGTGNSLRFHIQLHSQPSSKEELIREKIRLNKLGVRIMDDLREKLKAPRG